MYYVDPVIKSFMRTRQMEGRGAYIRLDQNENPDGVPQWLFDETMKRITPEYLSIYPEDTVLTEKYAAHFGLQPENVTLTDGSVVAMGYVIKVFGEPGKNLICATPTFGMYKVYADMQGMNTVFVRYEKDYTFDVNRMLEQIDENTGLVSLVNPSMPIGNVYAEEDIRKVILKAKKYNAQVIIDEAYYYFYDKTSLALLGEFDNVIILRTFSKMFSVPGLRLGVILSNKDNIQYVNNYKPHYTINSVALAFGEAIIDHHDRVVEELTAKFRAGKEYLLKALDANGYRYLPTEGCFICIYPKHLTAEDITDKLKKKGILIFCGKGDSAGFLRVTIWDRKYMEIFMKALTEIEG